MMPFTYQRVVDTRAALMAAAVAPTARYISGGTNLLDLMKLGIEQPTHLIDISRLPLDAIEATADGGLRIGAQVRNSSLAADQRIRSDYPVLAQALAVGRVSSNTEQGIHSRKFAAEDALLLFL